MKSIKEYLDKYTPDQIAKNSYYYEHLKEYFGNNIPTKYMNAYSNCSLLSNEYVFENLQTHDADKLKDKLKKEYGDDISFKDYSGDKNKSFYVILSDNLRIIDFSRKGGRLDTDFDNLEKFENILSFYNYYVSYTEKIDNKWALFIEPRYSDNVTNKFKNYSLYHFTDGKSAESILKNGLRLKTSRYRDFPKRIFLYATKDNLEDIKDKIKDFILIVGNRSKLYENELAILKITNNEEFDLYNDTAMKDDAAIFTYDFIPAKYIKKINVKGLTYKSLFK